MSKALVISGGGSKGAFAVGALSYMTQLNMSFDVFCGTSTGSLIAPFAALGDVATLETIYKTSTTDDILLKGSVANRVLRHSSLFDTSPLKNLIKKHITQSAFDQIKSGPKRVILSTVCLQTGKIVYFSTHGALPISDPREYDSQEIKTRDDLRDAMLASANQPAVMPPVTIKTASGQDHQYVDGGVREYLPLRAAVEAGATRIVAIALSSDVPSLKAGKFKNVVPILERTIDLFCEDVSLNDVKLMELLRDGLGYIDGVRQALTQTGKLSPQEISTILDAPAVNPFKGRSAFDIELIRLTKNYPSGGLEFIPKEMKEMFQDGYEAAKAKFQAPVGGDIT